MNAGLFYRLLLSLVLLFLTSTAVMAYLLFDEARNTVEKSRQKQAHTLVDGLAKGSLDSLVVKDYEQLERWLKSTTAIDGFAYSYLSNANGQIIAHTEVELVARTAEPLGAIKNTLIRDLEFKNRPVRELVHTIYLGNKHMANAHLAYYLDNLPFYSENIVSRLTILLLVLLAALSIATFFILRWMLAPIEKLADLIARTSNYQPDLPDKLLVRKDEVGLLARNFDELMQRLFDSYRDIKYQATHDQITDLLSRYEFEAQLKQTLEQTRTDNKTGSKNAVFCYLDIDQFKVINETAGHVAGDAMLKDFSARLREHLILPANTTLARLGGDEFGILLPGCNFDDAYKITEAIMQMLESYEFRWQQQSFSVSCSIGVVAVDKNSQSTTQLFADADVACYTAKERGRHGVYYYDEESRDKSVHSYDVSQATTLLQAMRQGRLMLYAQPIADLSRADNSIHHFELLLRMLDDNDEIVSSGPLITAAERFGLMPEVDRWVIDNAFKQAAQFVRVTPNVVLSINISGNSFSEKGLAEYVITKLAEHGVSPQNICFEITETAAINNLHNASLFIDKMRSYGCKFSLDDFGSGLSSFTYLKTLEVDYLKIDGQFVQNMLDQPIDHAMVAAINQIGHSMDIKTVAEFACSEHIIKRLKQMGVDFAQGYAVAKPFAITDSFSEGSIPIYW
jgi:diguanylate cyclase (GGDEF)-like protein